MKWREHEGGVAVSNPRKAICRCGRLTYRKPLDTLELMPRCGGCGDSMKLCMCPGIHAFEQLA
jgi:hypothetical protein